MGSSTPPPQPVLRGFEQDILVTLQKDRTTQTQETSVVASTRTKRFLKEGSLAASSSSGADPWESGQDPWKHWQGSSSSRAPTATPLTSDNAGVKRLTNLKDSLREELRSTAAPALPPGLEDELSKVQKMEVSVQELTAQGAQFRQWFKEAGQRMDHTDNQIQQLKTFVETNSAQVSDRIGQIQEEVTNKTELLQNTLHGSIAGMNRDLQHTLDSKLSSQFEKFEALLAKKARTDHWLGRPGCRPAAVGKPCSFFWLLWTFLLWPWTSAWGFALSVQQSSHAMDFSLRRSGSLLDGEDVESSFTSGIRFGEARHPGPPDDNADDQWLPPVLDGHVRVGCSNPCGLRGKEPLACSLGVGIWGYSETHLTLAAQHGVKHALQRGGVQQNRSIRALFGSPVALRSNSQTAGTWSGVAMHSDYPCQELQIAWPHGERAAGRAMVSRHFVGHHSLLIGATYGFPTSPTWPRHKELTQQLLQTMTKELVVGSSGFRLIMGDMNCSRDTPGEFDVWRRYGWQEIQQLAFDSWQQPFQWTCKGSTQVDHIWVSPEVAALCRRVGTLALFADHQTLWMDLSLPVDAHSVLAWPQPSEIPWANIEMDSWSSQFEIYDFSNCRNSDDFLRNWCQHWENSLDGFCKDEPQQKLPTRCKGRAHSISPTKVSLQPPNVRASRHGEVTLRSDLASNLVLRWFKQLRRLQSYVHSSRANKPTLAAECYRLNLWQAIKDAHGFKGGFAKWWLTQAHHSPAAPSHLPLAPPAFAVADSIFRDFQTNFVHLETWHIRRRCQLLQAKYDKTCKALFSDLRDQTRDQLDLLWSQNDFLVLACDSATGEVHLDSAPVSSGHDSWHWGSQTLDLRSVDGDVLIFASLPAEFAAGDDIQQRVVLSSVQDIHQALHQLWQPRWQKVSEMGSDLWRRITGFVQAHTPRLSFAEPTFDLSSWKATLRKFPAHAARGLDGISVKDLKSLPDVATQQLLDFLASIDGEAIPWPTQLLRGKVICLAKTSSAHLASHFRPVVILSAIYRAWGRMVAAPLLQQLARWVPSAALGFLPGRESAEVWMQLQAYIEVCCQQQLDFGGFSADVEKCFNHIGRGPLMFLAEHVGFPAKVLSQWSSFLKSFTRSFQARNTLSEPLDSCHGLPEGCAMSVVGMILIDWSYHVYMRALCPSVHAFSYVDNISVAGHNPLDVVAAFFSTVGFFQLWSLHLDTAKTFCWGVDKTSRQTLSHLGLQMCADAMELGGSLTYGRRKRNRGLKSKGAALAPKWTRLLKSRSPQSYKLQVLPVVFWAAALHGCAICPVAAGYLHDLRQQALKALRLKTAGANGKLRLTLAPKMLADPGYFQLQTTFLTFRRLCLKTGRLLDCWRMWWTSLDGRTTQGPFIQLLTMMELIGWELLQPPMFRDHSGLEHDLLHMEPRLLQRLLRDGWLQHTASSCCTRPTMATLRGLDEHLVLCCNRDLTAHQWSLQSSLQCGSFIDARSHSKYDVTVSKICKRCGVLDSHEHVLICPKYGQLRAKHGLHIPELLSWPKHFALHLLSSRSQWVDQLRAYYMTVPDLTMQFESKPVPAPIQHVFTDGSCFGEGRLELHRAAWAVINASSGEPIAAGHLPGVLQTIGRAELTAVLAAISWAATFGCRTHLWIDAQHIRDGLCQRISGGTTTQGETNADLWYEVDQKLAECAEGQISASWIPSHLDTTLCEGPFEEWVAHFNNAVDEMAVQTNLARSQDFFTLVERQQQEDELWMTRLKALRQFYFDVFEQTHSSNTTAVVEVVESSDSDSEGPLYSFSNAVSQIDFDLDCPDGLFAKFPVRFVQLLVNWLRTHEDPAQMVRPVSFLELTFGVLFHDPLAFPHRNPMTAGWLWEHPGSHFERRTLAYYYQILRRVLIAVCRRVGSNLLLVDLDRSKFGATMPLDGISLALCSATNACIGREFRRFTATRAVRRAADMARPI